MFSSDADAVHVPSASAGPPLTAQQSRDLLFSSYGVGAQVGTVVSNEVDHRAPVMAVSRVLVAKAHTLEEELILQLG